MVQLHRLLKAATPLASFAIMLSLIACAGKVPSRSAPPNRTRPTFPEMVRELTLVPDSAARARAATVLAQNLLDSHTAHVEDSTAFLWYHGPATVVYVAGDFNGWSPTETALLQIPQTMFFWTALRCDPVTRMEYKFVVDGQWMLDPANPQSVQGGFGMNSELRMPAYREPKDIVRSPELPEGSLDTLQFASSVLGRPFQVYVYVPAHSPDRGGRYPSVTVGDGSDYIALARMPTILDNLIGQHRLRPLIGVFLDPRTDPQDDRTNTRQTEYWFNARFVEFLAGELRDSLLRRYPISSDPQETAIMGASLGGLLATHVTVSHPEVYGLCGAQSPAYWVTNDSIFSIVSSSADVPRKVYLDTGTLHDAQEGASRMRDTLRARGSRTLYVEVPEGHNWSNWRARLDRLLLFLFGDT